MSSILSILFWLIYGYLTFWACYFLLFALAGHTASRRNTPRSLSLKFLVLIPAYKEDSVVLESARIAAEQSYPTEYFDVLVIADQLQPSTIDSLKQVPVKVLEVVFEKSTKSKSLNAALNSLTADYEAVVVLDADNHMQANFLAKVATRLKHHHIAVQGHRVAKNINTNLAFLDAVSEEINNHIFREGHKQLGLSSALIGSAMAFEFHLFKEIMADIDAIGGFDRELELRLIERGIKIDYVHDAYVLDEKVQRQEAFQNQRRRWLSAQFHYFVRYWRKGLTALLNGKLDYADKVVQGIQVPRLLLPGLLVIFGLISLITGVSPYAGLWLISLTIAILSMLISIPAKFYGIKMLVAVTAIPKTFLSMFLLIFKLKGANRTFIHTTHGEQQTTTKATNSH